MTDDRRQQDEIRVSGDADLHSLIVDDLADSRVTVETAGDTYEGYIEVRSENPFIVSVAGESIFAVDIWEIRSLETDGVWKVSGVRGVVDTDYRPEELRHSEASEPQPLDKLTTPPIPNADKAAEAKTQRKKKSKRVEARDPDEVTIPKDLERFASEALETRKVQLVIKQLGGTIERTVFFVDIAPGKDGWDLVVIDPENQSDRELIPASSVDLKASRVIPR